MLCIILLTYYIFLKINVIPSLVQITCVKIYDEDPDASAYPVYAAGGVGHNYIEINVMTTLGKGFRFHVQIFGKDKLI